MGRITKYRIFFIIKRIRKWIIRKYYQAFSIRRIEPLSLVKYDWDGLPESWKKDKINPYEGKTYVYFGEIPNMPGHSFLIDIKSGKPRVFHPESIKELTSEEV